MATREEKLDFAHELTRNLPAPAEIRDGWTRTEICEVVMHLAIYGGFPVAVEGMAIGDPRELRDFRAPSLDPEQGLLRVERPVPTAAPETVWGTVIRRRRPDPAPTLLASA